MFEIIKPIVIGYLTSRGARKLLVEVLEKLVAPLTMSWTMWPWQPSAALSFLRLSDG